MGLSFLYYFAAGGALAFAALAVLARARRRPVLVPVSVYYLLLSVPVFAITAASVYRSLCYSRVAAEPRFLLFAFCVYGLMAVVIAKKSGQFMALGVDAADFRQALEQATGFSGPLPADGRVPAGGEGGFISVHLHPGLQAAQAGLMHGADPGEATAALGRLADNLSAGPGRKGVWGLCLLLPALLSLGAAFYTHREIARLDGGFWTARAQAFAAAENYPAAALAAERAVAKGGGDRARALLGHVLAARGEKKQAAEVFSRMLEKGASDPEALAYAARFLAASAEPPEPERAVRLARQAVSLSPSCIPCMESLAAAHAAAGEAPEALRAQEELVKLLEAGGASEEVLAPMRKRLAEYQERQDEM